MPIIKSARKRAKQTKVRTARNLTTKRSMRSEIKAVESAVKAGDGKAAAEALVSAQSAIDTAVKKNIIHKNRAARKKSQLSTMVKSVSGSKPSAKAKKPAAKATAKTAKPAPKTATKSAKPATKKAPAKKPATTSKK